MDILLFFVCLAKIPSGECIAGSGQGYDFLIEVFCHHMCIWCPFGSRVLSHSSILLVGGLRGALLILPGCASCCGCGQ